MRPVGLLALSLAARGSSSASWARIDWDAVRDAIGKVALWQVPILLLVLVVRQVLNASPLALFIEGLGLRRAVQNDQAATLTSTIAPPPPTWCCASRCSAPGASRSPRGWPAR